MLLNWDLKVVLLDLMVITDHIFRLKKWSFVVMKRDVEVGPLVLTANVVSMLHLTWRKYAPRYILRARITCVGQQLKFTVDRAPVLNLLLLDTAEESGNDRVCNNVTDLDLCTKLYNYFIIEDCRLN